MKKRLFIAIPLPEDIRQVFAAYREDYPNLKARWTAEENLHITLYFCGDTDEKKIPALIESLGKINFHPFEMDFQKILFAPPGRPPRMVWAQFEGSKEFADLTREIYEAAKNFASAPEKPHENSTPHVTLARFVSAPEKPHENPIPHITLARFADPRAAAGVELTQPDIDIIRVEQYDLMQSHIGTQSPTYLLLKSYALT